MHLIQIIFLKKVFLKPWHSNPVLAPLSEKTTLGTVKGMTWKGLKGTNGCFLGVWFLSSFFTSLAQHVEVECLLLHLRGLAHPFPDFQSQNAPVLTTLCGRWCQFEMFFYNISFSCAWLLSPAPPGVLAGSL